MIDSSAHLLHPVERLRADPSALRSRAQWLAVLARASVEELERGMDDWPAHAVSWLRKPETGLMMVRARAGGDGLAFNLGELPVTRCAVKLRLRQDDHDSGVVGVGYVTGRSARQAELVALYDAVLQTADGARRTTATLAAIGQRLDAQRRERTQRAQATRVEFFTVAREARA